MGDRSVTTAAITGSWAAQRVAGLTSPQRDVHRRILRTFAAGDTPTRQQLACWSAEPGASDALALLAARDLVHRDRESGAVAVAYPFSAAPTRHHVALAPGVAVFAMCAIDALGIAFMLNQPAHVSSSDPVSREAISIAVNIDAPSEWSPDRAVVVLACSPGASISAQGTCPHTNFAASAKHAQQLVGRTPAACGSVLAMADAIALGRQTFGDLLDTAEPRSMAN